MLKTTVKIEGMACSMCEAHINDVIRQTVPDAKKVSASHTRGEATFQSEAPVDAEKLKAAIAATGYTFLSMASEPVEKKKFFWQR